MAGTTPRPLDSPAYPEAEARTRARFRRAWLAVGIAFAVAAGGILASQLPGSPLLGVVLLFVALGGAFALVAAVLWLGFLQVSQIRSRILQSRLVTSPVSPGQRTIDGSPATGAAVAGRAFLPPGYFARRRGIFSAYLVLGGLLLFATAVGVVTLATGSFHPVPSAIELVVLVPLLATMMFFLADANRDLPNLLEAGQATELRLDSIGISGAFYAASRYERAVDGAVMRTRWFRRVQGSLPAPNRIPWKLVNVTLVVPTVPYTPPASVIALTATPVPWWSGGLKLSIGFLPTGDRQSGYGLAVSVERRQLATILWWAFLGGSRLFADYRSLSIHGQAAVRGFLGARNTVWFRAGDAQKFLALPPPAAEDQLASWVP